MTAYQTSPSVPAIRRLQKEYEVNSDDPEISKEYAEKCRIFLEARFGDFFDDAAYPAWSQVVVAPTLMDHVGRMRGLVTPPRNDLFGNPVFKSLCSDSALADGSATLAVLNKVHHGRRDEVRPQDVALVAADLVRLCDLVEAAHEQCRLWRRREKLESTPSQVAPLPAMELPNFHLLIQSNLSAFTRGAAVGESQEFNYESLTSNWFENKALFYLRTENFGFAAPSGAIAIVEAIPSAIEDRRLVIARVGEKILARRVLRSPKSGVLALTAETPDPRKSPPTEQVAESDVALHRVVGVLFEESGVISREKTEAIAVAESKSLVTVRSAYRIKEDSDRDFWMTASEAKDYGLVDEVLVMNPRKTKDQ